MIETVLFRHFGSFNIYFVSENKQMDENRSKRNSIKSQLPSSDEDYLPQIDNSYIQSDEIGPVSIV